MTQHDSLLLGRENEAWQRLAQTVELPALVLDLDAFDRNTEKIRARAERVSKKLRPASKSIRCPGLIKRLFQRGGPSFQGLLTYSLSETLYLAECGFSDLLLAYPTLEPTLLPAAAERLRLQPSAITFMVDQLDHLQFLQDFWEKFKLPNPLSICVDLDLSYCPLGRHLGLHLGVQRSSIRSLADLESLLDLLPRFPGLRFRGLMGYEAQVAGLPDENPFSPLLNPAKKAIKSRSIRDITKRRAAAAAAVQARGLTLELFNGGGTGSLRSSGAEACLTEVTAGSGFYQSHLFDYYADNELEPALFIALRVTRRPDAEHITCQSGGFIASGEIAPEKAPIPVFPPGLQSLATEGFGEVQTPFRVPKGTQIALGSVILCRPAKAGEVTEHFSEILALRRGAHGHPLEIVERFPTYRGLGKVFR